MKTILAIFVLLLSCATNAHYYYKGGYGRKRRGSWRNREQRTDTPVNCTVDTRETCEYGNRFFKSTGYRICYKKAYRGWNGFNSIPMQMFYNMSLCVPNSTSTLSLKANETLSCGCCGGTCPEPCPCNCTTTSNDGTLKVRMNITYTHHRWGNFTYQKCVRKSKSVDKQLKYRYNAICDTSCLATV